MSEPTTDDYDKSDGWSDEQGCEICPHCELLYSGNGGYMGTVYDSRGRQYEHFYDTDPGQGPFFCPDCFEELDTNRKAAENATLEGFA